jgi:hypothetical protein
MDRPTDEQTARLAEIVDDGLAAIVNQVMSDPKLDALSEYSRTLGTFKYTVQLVTRAMKDLGVQNTRELLLSCIDEELDDNIPGHQGLVQLRKKRKS